MIALIQRASRAEVRSDGRLLGSISAGLMILLGVIEGDTMQDVNKLVKK